LKNSKKKIKIIGFDIDGTLTDGQVCFGNAGEIVKIFNAKDGFGIRKAIKNRLKICFITGRKKNKALVNRIEDWGIDSQKFLCDATHDKLKTAKELLEQHSLLLEEMAFMGDDTPDLELMKNAGLSACPSDAVREVKKTASFVSELPGGRGAARDFIDYILS